MKFPCFPYSLEHGFHVNIDQFLPDILIETIFYDLRGITTNNRIRFYIFCHNCSSGNYCSLPNVDARTDNGICSNPWVSRNLLGIRPETRL